MRYIKPKWFIESTPYNVVCFDGKKKYRVIRFGSKCLGRYIDEKSAIDRAMYLARKNCRGVVIHKHDGTIKKYYKYKDIYNGVK